MSSLVDDEIEFSRGCLTISRSFVWGKQKSFDDAIWFENFGGSCSNTERYPPRVQSELSRYNKCVLDVDGEPVSAPLLTLREMDLDTQSRDSTRTQTVSSSVDDQSPPSSHDFLVHQSSLSSTAKSPSSSRFRRRWRIRRRCNSHRFRDDYDSEKSWKRSNTFISCFGL